VTPLQLAGAATGPRPSLGPWSHTFAPGLNAILGPNGAGKTTLLLTIAGHRPLTSGHVLIDSRELSDRERQTAVAMLPQHPGLPHSFTVHDTVRYAAWLRKAPAPRVDRLIDTLGLVELQTRRVSRLSGGERQRVALAVVLLADPAVLLLDEPTAGLDPGQRHRFLELVQQVARSRVVLMTTHIGDDVDVADAVLLLNEGTITWSGALRDFFDAGRGRGALAAAYQRRIHFPPPTSDAVPGERESS